MDDRFWIALGTPFMALLLFGTARLIVLLCRVLGRAVAKKARAKGLGQ
jgi:hypothetical protein